MNWDSRCSRLFAGLLMIASPALSQEQANERNEAEFQRSAYKWMEAYNSGNSADLGSMYTEDANYVSSHVHGLVAHGRANVEENFRRGMSSGGHIDTIVVMAASVSCDLAYVHSRYEATNSGKKAYGRNILVLKKIGRNWLIKEHMTVVLE